MTRARHWRFAPSRSSRRDRRWTRSGLAPVRGSTTRCARPTITMRSRHPSRAIRVSRLNPPFLLPQPNLPPHLIAADRALRELAPGGPAAAGLLSDGRWRVPDDDDDRRSADAAVDADDPDRDVDDADRVSDATRAGDAADPADAKAARAAEKANNLKKYEEYFLRYQLPARLAAASNAANARDRSPRRPTRRMTTRDTRRNTRARRRARGRRRSQRSIRRRRLPPPPTTAARFPWTRTTPSDMCSLGVRSATRAKMRCRPAGLRCKTHETFEDVSTSV